MDYHPLDAECCTRGHVHSRTTPMVRAEVGHLGAENMLTVERLMCPAVGGLLFLLSAVPMAADTVDVRYWGSVDLDAYDCTDTVSSFVHRICYDQQALHLVVLLQDTWYPYCDIDPDTVAAWLNAESQGIFYNESIKNSAVDGRFSCAD
jgi:hypothetical protein